MKTIAAVIIGGLIAASSLSAQAAGTGHDAGQEAESRTMSLAERYLFELATESRHARKSGFLVLGAGAVMLGGGLALLSDTDDEDDIGTGLAKFYGSVMLIGTGGICVLGGTGMLIIASGPERKYEAVQGLPALHREEASREALRSLARSARNRRYVSGGLISAMAVYSLVGSSEPQSAILPGALAVYVLMRRTRDEKAYEKYLRAGGAPPGTIHVGLGPGPRGGLRIGLAASF